MKLILIRGLPGSGKSTLAKLIQNSSINGYKVFIDHYEADQYFIGNNGQYRFEPSKIKEAHQSCQDLTRMALFSGYDVIVSNTFVKQWEIQPYLDMAKEFGAQVQLIECKGQFGSIHGVPEATIQRMKEQWEEIKL